MNFYQSVFPGKLFRKYSQEKSGFGVIILQYLPFLARAMSPILFKKIRLYMPQIGGIAKKQKHFKFWYFLE